MEIGKKMAGYLEVMSKLARRSLVMTVIVFFLLAESALAAPAAPTIGATDWRTGEIETCWSGVTSGNTIILYAMTYASNGAYKAVDTWTANSSSGCMITKPFENGQTVWHYIVQVDPLDANNPSNPSNIGKQSPPLTAYIINWPDMFNDLKGALKALFDDLKKHMDDLATPSQPAMDALKAAVDSLKGAIGANTATNAGNDLKNAIDQAKSTLTPPGIHDDGVSTYTGGSGGLQLPNGTMQLTPPAGSGIGALNVPNCNDGTVTPLTISLTLGKKPDGTFLVCKLGTQEQFDKFPWLRLLRDLAAAALWIMFGIWLVQRFTPQFKT